MSRGLVLVVADDARFASFVLAGLRGEGYEVHLASSGPAAEALDQTRAFDLVLLDHRLAEGSVHALVRGWRASERTMPIILLTERDSAGEHTAAFIAGTAATLPKPFPLDALFNMVQGMLPA